MRRTGRTRAGLPRPLPRRFFARHTVVVARALLGGLLVHVTPRGMLVGRIVETEAYRGPRDPASHAYRRTPRSAIMYGLPGVAYVYLSHGVHRCLNVVTEDDGRPGAVLLRAVEPLRGLPLMRRRAPGVPAARIASGPGRLARALGITLRHNGADLTRPPLYLAAGRRPGRVVAGPRVGVGAAIGRRWRFGVAGHPSLSRPFRPVL
ncbi:MAG: DNA-3-methyladenine glycosylase [Armatimonadota bacterium]|nr:DNA-3-methyladenine glycosylase [Armatimonadota bacterium]MDR7512854.1 DNA-3-methyladenine glycosylase [Armatimonadota bacterium]